MSLAKSSRNWWKISTVTLVLVIGLLSSSFAASYVIHPAKAQVYTVGLSQPTSSVNSISKGESLKLTVDALNGSQPYTYSWSDKIWYSDGNSTSFTVFSSEQNPTFTLTVSCEYINFVVRVTDAQGMTGFGSTTVWDPTALSTMTLAGGPVPGAPSYTIWGESGTYYAKDAWGAISFTSTNSSTLFNLACASGEQVTVTQGIYLLTGMIEPAANTTLTFMKGALLQIMSSMQAAIYVFNNGVTIDGAEINANQQSATGILVQGVNGDVVKNCNIYNLQVVSGGSPSTDGIHLNVATHCTVTGNYVSGGRNGILLDTNSSYNFVTSNNITLTGLIGIYINGGSWWNDISHNYVINGNNDLINVANNCSYNSITLNHLIFSVLGDGVVYGSDGGTTSSYGTIALNTIESVHKGVYLYGAVGDMVTGNMLESCVNPIYEQASGVSGAYSNTITENQLLTGNTNDIVLSATNTACYGNYGSTVIQNAPGQDNTFGLSLKYDMNEASGTTLYDSGGNGVSGTINGATFCQGRFGSGLQFDGIDDGVIINKVLGVTTQITISLWFNTSETGTNNTLSFSDGSALQIWSGYAYLNLNGEPWNPVNIGYSANTWTHLTITFDGTTVTYYLNGIFVATRTFSYAASNLNTLSSIAAASPFFGGQLDDLRIYHIIEDSNQILTLYKYVP